CALPIYRHAVGEQRDLQVRGAGGHVGESPSAGEGLDVPKLRPGLWLLAGGEDCGVVAHDEGIDEAADLEVPFHIRLDIGGIGAFEVLVGYAFQGADQFEVQQHVVARVDHVDLDLAGLEHGEQLGGGGRDGDDLDTGGLPERIVDETLLDLVERAAGGADDELRRGCGVAGPDGGGGDGEASGGTQQAAPGRVGTHDHVSNLRFAGGV